MFRHALLAIAIVAIALPARADEMDDQLAASLLFVARDPTATTFARINAVKAIGRMGPRGCSAVPGLTRLMPQTRYPHLLTLQEATIDALGQIGAPARPVMALIMRESGRNIDIDLAVARSVDAIMQAADEPDLPMLIQHLHHRDPGTRLRAAKSLGLMGTSARLAVPSLYAALADTDADVRRTAVCALRRVQPDVPPCDAEAAAIALDLQERDPANRLRAVKMLGNFGPAANAAVGALTAALDDRDPDVRRLAQDVLGHLPPPPPLPAPAPGPAGGPPHPTKEPPPG